MLVKPITKLGTKVYIFPEEGTILNKIVFLGESNPVSKQYDTFVSSFENGQPVCISALKNGKKIFKKHFDTAARKWS